MDYHGLSWTIIDYYTQSYRIISYQRLQTSSNLIGEVPMELLQKLPRRLTSSLESQRRIKMSRNRISSPSFPMILRVLLEGGVAPAWRESMEMVTRKRRISCPRAWPNVSTVAMQLVPMTSRGSVPVVPGRSSSKELMRVSHQDVKSHELQMDTVHFQ